MEKAFFFCGQGPLYFVLVETKPVPLVAGQEGEKFPAPNFNE